MKLLIWGTGKLARQFINNGYNGEIVGFIQTHRENKEYMDLPVYEPANINTEYDFIVVANSYSTDIYRICLSEQIDLDRVIFLYAVKQPVGFIECDVIESVIGEKNFTCYCAEINDYENSFFVRDKELYQQMNKRESFSVQDQYLRPIIKDKYAEAGTISNYFWQDLWAAKKIIACGVSKHFDIGSRLDGFIAHLLAANIDVTMIDIRDLSLPIDGLNTIISDATMLSQIEDESIESMSALCSLEHFGLGRYGDPIDPESCFKCFVNIQKKLKPGADLYISLPIGRERVEFNAHRIFYPQTVVEAFDGMKLVEFSCTADGLLEQNVDIHKYDSDAHQGDHRYGLFHFKKPIS